MSEMKPTVGRVVYVFNAKMKNQVPLVGLISAVNDDGTVNLAVFTEEGKPMGDGLQGVSHFDMVNKTDQVSGNVSFWMWMPYQVGQAKKTEAAEKTAVAAVELLKAEVDKLTAVVAALAVKVDAIKPEVAKAEEKPEAAKPAKK